MFYKESTKSTDLFQSYYSLISNNSSTMFCSLLVFQSYYSLISNFIEAMSEVEVKKKFQSYYSLISNKAFLSLIGF